MVFKKFEDINIRPSKEKIKEREKKEKREKIKLSKEEKLKAKEEKKRLKEEMKNLKKTDRSISAYTKDIMDFVDIDEDDRFIMKYGYMDLYQIKTKDVHALSESDIQRHIYSFISFLRAYSEDFKILSMNFPVNTTTQQKYIEKNLKVTTNPIAKKFLQRKLDELIFLEQNRFDKEFYIMIFASNKEEIEDRERVLYMNQNIAFKVEEINLEKKLKILFKLNNFNTKLN